MEMFLIPSIFEHHFQLLPTTSSFLYWGCTAVQASVMRIALRLWMYSYRSFELLVRLFFCDRGCWWILNLFSSQSDCTLQVTSKYKSPLLHIVYPRYLKFFSLCGCPPAHFQSFNSRFPKAQVFGFLWFHRDFSLPLSCSLTVLITMIWSWHNANKSALHF